MKTKNFVLLTLFVLLINASCKQAEIDYFQREDLFSIEIGPMEDQIALYKIEGTGGIRQIELAMRDGFFYITDWNGGKIVRYNSYGDLLFMIYNKETSPQPLTLRERTEDGPQATRWAYTYPLVSPGKIIVDSQKRIFVEEKLPRELHEFDEKNNALLDSVVLHFDTDGRFIEYLGQGGRGGSPFPRINGLYGSVNDEFAVVCRMPGGWHTYWFNSYGEQLFNIQIENNVVPIPSDWTGISASIDTIMAAPDNRKLFLKIDYYRDVFDLSSNNRISTEPFKTLIWILNAEDGSYEKYIEVPLFETSFYENDKIVNMNLLYSMFGLVQDGGIFFYFPVETGFNILRIDSNSNERKRGFLEIDPDELQFNIFHLSPEGILSTILIEESKVNVVWWRMDKSMWKM